MLKRCSKCKSIKPHEEFYRHVRMTDNLNSHCKECSKEYSRQHRASMSPEKKAKEIKRLHDWRAKNPEKVHAKGLKYNRINKVRRASRMKKLPATLTSKEWEETLSALDYKCVYCGAPYEHQDHFIPLVKGGGYTVNNILPACFPCNNRKADKMPFDFIKSSQYNYGYTLGHSINKHPLFWEALFPPSE